MSCKRDPGSVVYPGPTWAPESDEAIVWALDGLAELDKTPEVELPTSEEEVLLGPIRCSDVTIAAPLEFLVDGLLVRRETNAVVGDGDAYKTTLQVAVSTAIAAAGLAVNERVLVPGAVLLVSGEDGREFIRNRVEAIAAGHGWDSARALHNVWIYDEDVDLDDPRWQLRLMDAARDVKAVLACFDPLVDLCGQGVEENSNSDAKRVTRFFRAFTRATDCTPWLSMHITKPAEGRTDRKYRVRGASAWKNACRMVWWAEACEGGLELDPIKANRLARPRVLRVKRTVVTDPEFPLMWRAARFDLDVTGDVVHRNVLTVLRYLANCATPPSGREMEDGDHGLTRDPAREALAIGKARGWIDATPGPRRSLLHTVTEAGRARLLLAGEA